VLQPQRVIGYIKAMVRLGHDANQVLANTGLTVKELNLRHTTISALQSQALIRNMVALTENEALGFELGAATDLNEMGLLGHAMVAAPSFRHTITLWQTYAASLYGTHMQLSVQESDGRNPWLLYMDEDLTRGLGYRFCLEEYLAMAYSLGNSMSHSPVQYHSLSLVYDPPKHHALYSGLFDCSVEFNAPRNCLAVAAPQLDTPLVTRDDYLYGVYRQYCSRLSKREGEDNQVSYRIHNYLLKGLGQTPAVEAAADSLGMSVRTLKRRLQEEGTCFRQLLAEFRLDFARQNLTNGGLRSKEVAYLLGYQDTKPFLRAFKKWTGMTIGEYQKTSP
jgi:AraC-like DNA-binding protein